MSDDYTTKPASEVKAGDIIYWASVRADVEVVSAGPPGFYGYTFDVRYKGEIEQARYKVGETVQVKRLERKSEKQWWEESPEEFANGFTEEVHTHHGTESEIKPVAINQNSNEAMAALYGPAAAHSEYSRFTRVRYREAGKEKAGLIIWITSESENGPVEYIVEGDGGGFPDFISQADILDALP